MKNFTTILFTEKLAEYRANLITGLQFRLPFPEKLAEYLVDNGALIAPVKIGESVYIPIPPTDEEPPEIKTATIDGLTFTTEHISIINDGIPFKLGIECFLSYTEAEKALQNLPKQKTKPRKPRKQSK